MLIYEFKFNLVIIIKLSLKNFESLTYLSLSSSHLFENLSYRDI